MVRKNFNGRTEEKGSSKDQPRRVEKAKPTLEKEETLNRSEAKVKLRKHD